MPRHNYEQARIDYYYLKGYWTPNSMTTGFMLEKMIDEPNKINARKVLIRMIGYWFYWVLFYDRTLDPKIDDDPMVKKIGERYNCKLEFHDWP